MTKLSKKIVPCLLFAVVFIYYYIFFTQIYPIVIRSGDDWTYIGSWRLAIPMLQEWNPSKILPETVMPMLAYFAVYLIMPFTNDYISALTIMFALFVAFVIAVYIYSFYQYVKCKFELSESCSAIISLLFLLLHYLIFNNAYLLQMGVINNYLNYTIPTLLNIILILVIERFKIYDFNALFRSGIRGGVIFLLLYLAMFSNMYSNYVLTVYAGVNILLDWVVYIKEKNPFSLYKLVGWLKQRIVYLLIIGFWGLAAFFEMSGERAAKARETSDGSYLSALRETLIHLKQQICAYNRVFLVFIIVVTVMVVFALWSDRKRNIMMNQRVISVLLKSMISCVLSLVYVILLSAMVKPYYIKDMGVLMGPCIFLLFCISAMVIYILRKFPGIMTIIPFLFYIFVFFVGKGSLNNIPNCQAYMDLDNYYIEQFKQADREGLTEFTLDADSTVPSYFGNRVARTLYRHGIVSKQMNVETNPNPEVDEMFGL